MVSANQDIPNRIGYWQSAQIVSGPLRTSRRHFDYEISSSAKSFRDTSSIGQRSSVHPKSNLIGFDKLFWHHGQAIRFSNCYSKRSPVEVELFRSLSKYPRTLCSKMGLRYGRALATSIVGYFQWLHSLAPTEKSNSSRNIKRFRIRRCLTGCLRPPYLMCRCRNQKSNQRDNIFCQNGIIF
jgi:hypothetical protein